MSDLTAQQAREIIFALDFLDRTLRPALKGATELAYTRGQTTLDGIEVSFQIKNGGLPMTVDRARSLLDYLGDREMQRTLEQIAEETADPWRDRRTWCCRVCQDAVRIDTGMIGVPMVTCSRCGNKRCPSAEWHRYECTGSNELGQQGVTADE